MRFTAAWAETFAQNVNLRFGLVTLSVVSISLAIATASLSLKQPLLIERGCFSKVVATSSTEHPDAEIENFIRVAIPERFSSDMAPIPGHLSADEEFARGREQKEMGTRAMTQTVVIRSIKVSGSSVIIDADRLISVAQIRSAFMFPLQAEIGSVARSEGNPYGLQLIKVTELKREEKK